MYRALFNLLFIVNIVRVDNKIFKYAKLICIRIILSLMSLINNVSSFQYVSVKQEFIELALLNFNDNFHYKSPKRLYFTTIYNNKPYATYT